MLQRWLQCGFCGTPNAASPAKQASPHSHTSAPSGAPGPRLAPCSARGEGSSHSVTSGGSCSGETWRLGTDTSSGAPHSTPHQAGGPGFVNLASCQVDPLLSMQLLESWQAMRDGQTPPSQHELAAGAAAGGGSAWADGRAAGDDQQGDCNDGSASSSTPASSSELSALEARASQEESFASAGVLHLQVRAPAGRPGSWVHACAGLSICNLGEGWGTCTHPCMTLPLSPPGRGPGHMHAPLHDPPPPPPPSPPPARLQLGLPKIRAPAPGALLTPVKDGEAAAQQSAGGASAGGANTARSCTCSLCLGTRQPSLSSCTPYTTRGSPLSLEAALSVSRINSSIHASDEQLCSCRAAAGGLPTVVSGVPAPWDGALADVSAAATPASEGGAAVSAPSSARAAGDQDAWHAGAEGKAPPSTRRQPQRTPLARLHSSPAGSSRLGTPHSGRRSLHHAHPQHHGSAASASASNLLHASPRLAIASSGSAGHLGSRIGSLLVPSAGASPAGQAPAQAPAPRGPHRRSASSPLNDMADAVLSTPPRQQRLRGPALLPPTSPAEAVPLKQRAAAAVAGGSAARRRLNPSLSWSAADGGSGEGTPSSVHVAHSTHGSPFGEAGFQQQLEYQQQQQQSSPAGGPPKRRAAPLGSKAAVRFAHDEIGRVVMHAGGRGRLFEG